MRKNFTGLVSVIIAYLCVFSVLSQERIISERIVEENNYSKHEVELRSYDEYWWPDSVVTYNYLGYPISTRYPDQENGSTLVKPNVKVDLNPAWTGYEIEFTTIWTSSYYRIGASIDNLNTVYDGKGNLTLLENPSPEYPENSTIFHLSYNDNNNPVSIEYYLGNTLFAKHQYEYDEDGYCILYKVFSYSEENNLLEMRGFETLKFDAKRRPIQGSSLWFAPFSESSKYYFYYYSDGTNMSDVEIENNVPVSDENQGSFDLNIKIPTDSISNGSIIISFPNGFILDEKNTSLTLDFSNLFILTVTKQENNSWLFEITPKALRGASLRSDAITKMLQVAYTVDEKLQRGTYSISVNSIIFETKGGHYIAETAITVPSVVERWGVGNEPMNTLAPVVYTNNQTVYIQAANAERITIYSIMGQRLYEIDIQSGLNVINVANFSKGLLIIHGSSGWTKKLIAK